MKGFSLFFYLIILLFNQEFLSFFTYEPLLFFLPFFLLFQNLFTCKTNWSCSSLSFFLSRQLLPSKTFFPYSFAKLFLSYLQDIFFLIFMASSSRLLSHPNISTYIIYAVKRYNPPTTNFSHKLLLKDQNDHIS